MGDTLTKEIKGWIVLAMFIVVGSVVLLKFRTVSGVCDTGFTFNTSTANTCYETANVSNTVAANGNLGTTINSFVNALSEPSSWVAIVIIAIIGYGIMKYFQGKRD